MKRLLLFSLLSTMFCSCYTDIPSGSRTNSVFDAAVFVEDQLNYLQNGQREIRKVVTYNKQTDTLSYSPDTAYWRNELQLLADLNINKPTFSEQFTIDTTTDNGTTLVVYKALTDQSEVRDMALSYKDEELSEIEIMTETENYLFYNTRKLNYLLESGKLKAFQVRGVKKVVFTNEVPYQVDVKILR